MFVLCPKYIQRSKTIEKHEQETPPLPRQSDGRMCLTVRDITEDLGEQSAQSVPQQQHYAYKVGRHQIDQQLQKKSGKTSWANLVPTLAQQICYHGNPLLFSIKASAYKKAYIFAFNKFFSAYSGTTDYYPPHTFGSPSINIHVRNTLYACMSISVPTTNATN